MKDPMLCAPCRVGDHRSHNEDGCCNENNFNSECECKAEPLSAAMLARDERVRQAIDEMNALPDISGNDSERLQEFVRVTTREVKAVGGASAGTTLEMIGYIRELEHALTNTRAAVTAPRGDVVDEALEMFKEVYDTVTFLGGETIHIAVGSELANKLIAAAPSSPTPAAPSVVDAIAELIKMRDEYADDERVTRPVNTLNAAIERLAFANSNATPAERTRVEGEQSWCDHCSADLNGVKHILCERCYREYAGPRWFDPEFNASTQVSDSARRAAREWMDTYHAAFKTNQEREDALVAIISKHFAAAPADNDAESLPVCPDCQQGYVCEDCGKPIGNYYPTTTTKGAR